jgi:hypothetical protein
MATEDFALLFGGSISSGALVADRVNERKLWAAAVELDYGFRQIRWVRPDDTSIFGSSPPWVEVVATDVDRRIWSQQQMWGGIWPRSIEWVAGAFMWETERVSSVWVTTIRAFGRASDNYQDGDRMARMFVAQAMGTD